MKSVYLILMIAACLNISACQTASTLQSASQKSIAESYSCSQVYAVFDAYNADKVSLSALGDIAKASGLVLAQNPNTDPSAYYDGAKNAANLILLTQGCQPL
ncbi:hypothetical protein [Dasania marina]|uniref:hypothetical protein n=1 Tax=Dasania marina TaxID=471499 RepID=UPI00036FA6DC|nr:hypothetical protein [Dasania marina]|tara:strand:+ start:45857 stop:46162 length:306 start_codon:yes stop_codon:yes gene_type:complete